MFLFSKIMKKLTKVLPIFVLLAVILMVIGDEWKPLANAMWITTGILFVAILILKVFAKNEISMKACSLTGKTKDFELFDLTESKTLRTRIVQTFSSEYGLGLTSRQVREIVSASYISYYWAREIYDMTKDYSNVERWYSGETDWLRIYLYAFPSLNITPDFKMQYNYVIEDYRRIFIKMDAAKYLTMKDYLKEVNNRFLTNFDENMFVQIVHFMDKNGYSFKFPTGIHIENEPEVEKIMKKYDEEM